MIIFLIIYNIIAVACIIHAIFNFKDVVSWLYVSSKHIAIEAWDMIKRFLG